MVGTNVLKTQLRTGTVEKPSVVSSAKDSGAMNISLTCAEGRLSDENNMELNETKCKVDKRKKIKFHRGTQTKTFTLPIAAITVHGSMEGNQNQYV